MEQLKDILSRRSEIKGWMIQVENIHRRERYFLLDKNEIATDQDREVKQQNIRLRIFVNKKDPARQGEAEKMIKFSLPLEEQVDSAVRSALETDIQKWELPAKLDVMLPKLKTADLKMLENLDKVMQDLTEQIYSVALKKRDVIFNSAELFLSVHDYETHLSNGLTHHSNRTKIFAEAAFSTLLAKRSDEYLEYRWASGLKELSIDELFNEAAERARFTSLVVKKPESGSYFVLVDSAVLDLLMHDYLTQLSGGSKYLKLPFIEVGQELIKGAEGDLINLKLDPYLDYGADTTAISPDGLLQKPMDVVRDNRVLETLSGKQYSDYLNKQPTTVRGNLVMPPGKYSRDQLISLQPKILEVLQFSALFTDPYSGTFSSEIRLGRIFDREKGTVEYIKGGSLSGSIFANFKNVRFSDKLVTRSTFSPGMSASGESASGYFGPEYALLADVSVVG
ncbi:MAG: metallopeptidase TldD-related protein [bacterium]|nr:metallopeptidase TldD-related protein [bacterium]